MTADVTDLEIEYIEKHGKHYKSAALPDDIAFGRLGWCFDDCVMRAFASNGKYKYVEGIATDPEAYTWILHAWLTDGEHAFDPTWSRFNPKTQERVRMVLPSSYIGIEMPLEKVIRFMEKTGYQGIIANRHLAPELAMPLIGSLIC